MATLDQVLEKVTETDSIAESLVVLTKGIKKQLDDVLSGSITPDQQAKIDAIFAKADETKNDIATAILENTPQQPDQPIDPV